MADQESARVGGSEEVVSVFEFQSDGEATFHTWALLEQPLPPLHEFTICFWFNVFFWRTFSSIVSLARDPINDNILLLGGCMQCYHHIGFIIIRCSSSSSI